MTKEKTSNARAHTHTHTHTSTHHHTHAYDTQSSKTCDTSYSGQCGRIGTAKEGSWIEAQHLLEQDLRPRVVLRQVVVVLGGDLPDLVKARAGNVREIVVLVVVSGRVTRTAGSTDELAVGNT